MQERKEVWIEMKSPGLWAGLANSTLPVLRVSQLTYYHVPSLNSGKHRMVLVGTVDGISQPWSVLPSLKVLGIQIMIVFNPTVRILTVTCLQSPLLPKWSLSHLLADHRGCFPQVLTSGTRRRSSMHGCWQQNSSCHITRGPRAELHGSHC